MCVIVCVYTHALRGLDGQGSVPLLAPVQLACRSLLGVLCDMSRSDSLTSLLSQQETRTASTSLLVIGILVGGSAATAALWLRSKRSLSWSRHDVDKSSQLPDKSVADQFICVLDGLSRPCRQDAIEVATCFGITDVWVRCQT